MRTARNLIMSEGHRIETSGEGETAFHAHGLFHFRSEPIQILQVHNLAKLALLLFITVATILMARHIDVRNPYSNGMVQIAHSAIDRTAFAFRNAIARVAPRMIAPPDPSAFEQEHQMSGRELMDQWSPFIQEASQRFSIPAAWIRAVMQAESGGRTMLGENQPITSAAGAVGLMQLMPATYEQVRKQNGLSANSLDPHDNIMAGAAYLRWLYQKYGYPKMFAAYNAGPAKLQNHLATGQSLPVETRNYVTRIGATLGAVLSLGGDQHKVNKPRVAAYRDLAKFTRPNGSRVSIDVATIVSVRRPLRGEYAHSVKSVISAGKVRQAVRESVATVKAAMRTQRTA